MFCLSKENIPPCYICGKIWKRKDYKNWVFFDNNVFCKSHHGIEELYERRLQEADKELEKNRRKAK